jgi:protein TonB
MNPPSPPVTKREDDFMPTLFGKGYDIYQVKRAPFAYSLLANVAVVALLIWAGAVAAKHPEIFRPVTVSLAGNIPPLPPSDKQSGGGGGGRSSTPATKGELPKQSLKPQIVPPLLKPLNDHPKLALDETILAPKISMATGNNAGDPLAKYGAGSLGNGGGYGIGNGHGSGYGPGDGGGVGGGHYVAGKGGVSNPRAIYSPEPEYSEEGRKAKQQGEVMLEITVGVDGRAHDVRVVRSLGFGLDEEAVKVVSSQWRFEPATLHGQKVPVKVNVAVDFTIY